MLGSEKNDGDKCNLLQIQSIRKAFETPVIYIVVYLSPLASLLSLFLSVWRDRGEQDKYGADWRIGGVPLSWTREIVETVKEKER